MNSTEIPMEIIEHEVEIEEIEPNVETDIQDTSAAPGEIPDEIPVESPSAPEVSENENEMLMEIIELLSDPEGAEVTDGSESEPIIEIDCTETLVMVHDELVRFNQSMDVVVMVLIAWFGSWVLRSWRTWMVKGGK